MKARPLILLATSVTAVWLLWMTMVAQRDSEELRARLAAGKESQARLVARLQEKELALATWSARPTPQPTVATTTATRSPLPRPTSSSPGAHAYNDPQLLNLFIASKKAELQERYRALFERLNLSPAQRDAFKTALTAHTTREIDIAAAAHGRGLQETDPDIARLRADSDRQVEAELVPLLGAAGLADYKEFARTIPVRGYVDSFAAQLAARDPLKPLQTEQLIRVFVNASPTYRNGGEAVPAEIDWSAVDREAQSFLSPVQFAAWKLDAASTRYGQARGHLEFNRLYEAAVARDRATRGTN